MTLSRLPIEGAGFERYFQRGPAEQIQTGEYLSGKGFARLKLQTSEGPVSFINTHLHARYALDFEHEFKSYRTAQIVQLSTSSALTLDPVIVAGDFNFAEDQTEYAVFAGLTGLSDSAAELDLRKPTVYSSNPYRRASYQPKRIDFVFRRDGVSRSVTTRHVERIFDGPLAMRGRRGACSNHAGVLAEFEIAPRSETPLVAPLAWAIREASQLLAEGRTRSEERQSEFRAYSCAGGIASVLAAGAGLSSRKVNRRKLLRNVLRGAALAAFTPTLGSSMLSEFFVPGEIHAFEDAEARLAKLGRELGILQT